MRIAFLFLTLFSLQAQTFQPRISDILEGTLWAPFDPPIWDHPEISIERIGDDAFIARVMLEIARRSLSLMIFGGELTYVPYDRSRGVAEDVRLTKLGEIPWGDSNLTILTTFIDRPNNSVQTTFRYFLRPEQLWRLQPWRSGSLVSAAGAGSVPWLWDAEVYSRGIEQAIKETVREWLRARHFNKPREIKVRFILREVPNFQINAGQLVTRVKIMMLPPEVRDYEYF